MFERVMRKHNKSNHLLQILPLIEYDFIASEYYSQNHITSRNFDQATANFCQSHELAFPSCGLVLDLGAGRGTAGRLLGFDSSRIIQADRSQNMLTLSNREPSLGRVLCDASGLPFADACFKVVCAFLFDPYLSPELFAAIRRVLKPGGVFFGTLPAKIWGDTIRRMRGYPTNVARFITLTGEYVDSRSLLASPESLSRQLAHAGFSDIKIQQLFLPEHTETISPDISDAAAAAGTRVHELPIIDSVFARI